MKLGKSQIAFLALSALYIALTYFSRHFAFFGDMIQFASRHANYYYENNFKNFWLSNDLDSGHPQVFGMYMAFMWKIFGRTLAVSHVVMLPYLI